MPTFKKPNSLPVAKLRLFAFALSSQLLTVACTQHHALSTTVVQDQAFYGTAVESGSNKLQAKSHSKKVKAGDKQSNKLTERFNYASDMSCDGIKYLNLPYHYRADSPLLLEHNGASKVQHQQSRFGDDLPLSPGDMLEITLLNGEGFEGRYIVDPDGKIQLPLVESVTAIGLGVNALAEKLELALVRAQIFLPNTARVGVRVLQWAPIEVSVAGAVFEPGRVLINNAVAEQIMQERTAAFGDYTPTRYLSEALRAASGIRPDAKIDQVIVIRNGWQVEVDMSGILLGQAVNDVLLVAGDRVIVPTTGCFQQELVKPSQITPRGYRVFMSNLIDSAKSNANAAIGQFSSSLPYGTRLLQAAISANCVGGTSWTNAPRKVLLASKNPLSGKTEVIERSVEQLIRQGHEEGMNPYLMPNDAIACYDSDVTNFRDIARTIGDIISPLKLL